MMLLQSFTWQTFLIAAMILSAVWYLGIGRLFYRKYIAGFLSGGRGKGFEPLPHGWQNEVDELAPDLVGGQKQEHGVSVLEADEFHFVPAGSAATAPDPLGELADVQQEIKSICRILEKEDGTKEDFLSLFVMIRNKYPKVASSGLLRELNEFIREHAPFHLSEQELDSLWV